MPEREPISHAEFARFVQEAQDMRRERDDALAAAAHWRTLAEQHARERDAFRRTLADLLEIHPARIVAPAE